jgi:hypothetical protein
MLFGKVESQYLVGASAPAGHSISSHSLARLVTIPRQSPGLYFIGPLEAALGW